MKAKLLTRVNALIGLILGLFGFSCVSCVEYGVPVPVAEYGCPYATFEAKGKVTDENAQPVQNIRVQIKKNEQSAFPDIYTDENGEYNTFTYNGIFPLDSVDIIVSDTADIYAPDSVRVKVDYDRSQVAPSDHWNAGSGSVYQDFQLKKK